MRWAKIEREVRFVACVAGIYFCFIYYSIVQERISKAKYDNERFPSVFFLILAQCCVSVIVSHVPVLFSKLSALFVSSRPARPHTNATTTTTATTTTAAVPFPSVALVAVSYLGSMLLSNYSLRYVDYPSSVLAKSVKPIPVMVAGVVMNHRHYSWGKYLRVFLMSVGVAMFMYHPHEAAAERKVHLFGYALLLASLALDGFTGPFQERLLKKVDEMTLMYYTNLMAALYLCVAMVLSGEVTVTKQFLMRHPEAALDVAQCALLNAVGQSIIYYTVANWSALACTIVTTTRKFLTILASVVYFGHVLSTQQWLAVILVFGALLAEMQSSYLGAAWDRVVDVVASPLLKRAAHKDQKPNGHPQAKAKAH